MKSEAARALDLTDRKSLLALQTHQPAYRRRGAPQRRLLRELRAARDLPGRRPHHGSGRPLQHQVHVGALPVAPVRSGHHLAAVDVEGRAVDEGRRIGGQEHHRLGDFPGLAQPSHRDGLGDSQGLLERSCLQHTLGGGGSGGNGIDGDPAAAPRGPDDG